MDLIEKVNIVNPFFCYHFCYKELRHPCAYAFFITQLMMNIYCEVRESSWNETLHIRCVTFLASVAYLQAFDIHAGLWQRGEIYNSWRTHKPLAAHILSRYDSEGLFQKARNGKAILRLYQFNCLFLFLFRSNYLLLCPMWSDRWEQFQRLLKIFS